MKSCIAVVTFLVTVSAALAEEPAASSPAPSANASTTSSKEMVFDRKCGNGTQAPDPIPMASQANAPRVTQEGLHALSPQLRSRFPGPEGTAMLITLVNEEGLVVRAAVERSSGNPEFDQEALKHTQAWRLLPGTIDGKPACMWSRMGITFKRTD